MNDIKVTARLGNVASGGGWADFSYDTGSLVEDRVNLSIMRWKYAETRTPTPEFVAGISVDLDQLHRAVEAAQAARRRP